MVTLSDLAKLANVSKATVSLAINGKPGVGQQKREEILALARAHGYEPQKKGERRERRKLRFIKYKVKGYFVYQNGDFIERVFDGVENEARKHGCSLAVTNVDNESLQEMIPKINAEEDDGIIFLGTELEGETASILKRFRAPVVVIDNEMRYEDYNIVVMDNDMAVYLAVQHLFQMGHREIGHITSTYHVGNMVARTEAYRRVLDHFGLVWNPEHQYQVPTEAEACNAALREQMEGKNLPTAILADNDYIAITLLLALEKLGKRVPEDVSVMGIDDLTISAVTRPELTTVRLEKKRMGEVAVRRLLQIMGERKKRVLKILTGCRLVRRQSVGNRPVI